VLWAPLCLPQVQQAFVGRVMFFVVEWGSTQSFASFIFRKSFEFPFTTALHYQLQSALSQHPQQFAEPTHHQARSRESFALIGCQIGACQLRCEPCLSSSVKIHVPFSRCPNQSGEALVVLPFAMHGDGLSMQRAARGGSAPTGGRASPSFHSNHSFLVTSVSESGSDTTR